MYVSERQIKLAEGDNHTELVALKFTVHQQTFTVISAYPPPYQPISPTSLNNALPPAGEAVLFAGDINVHTSAFYNAAHLLHGADDARAASFVQWVADNNLQPENDPDTYTCTSGSVRSAVDVTLSRGVNVCNWRTCTSTTKHEMISYEIALDKALVKAPRRTRYAWKKVKDWQPFVSAVERKISDTVEKLPLSQRLTALTNICRKAARKHVPAGCHSNELDIMDMPDVQKAQTEALAACEVAKTTCTHQDQATARELTLALNQVISARKRELFASRTSRLDPRSGASWKFINGRRKPPSKSLRHAIKYAKAYVDGTAREVTADSDLRKAEAFNWFYSRHSRATKSRPLRRLRMARTKYDMPVTDEEVRAATSELQNGKACGKDEMYPEMIKRLGPKALALLYCIVKESVETGNVPQQLRHAIIVPIDKPGKPGSALEDYRPISLTSAIAKILEKVVVRRLLAIWKPSVNQYAYRKNHSTEDALVKVADFVHDCLNSFHTFPYPIPQPDGSTRTEERWRRDRAMAIFIDFSAAFDLIDHHRLAEILKDRVPSAFINKWFRNFLRGRYAQTRIGRTMSKSRPVTVGVPQGTVAGPQLFLLYVDEMLREITAKFPNVLPVMYADDLTLIVPCDDMQDGIATATPILALLNKWAEENNMKINATKSEALLFSYSSRTEEDKVEDAVIPLGDNCINVNPVSTTSLSKLLGLLFENRANFSNHLKRISSTVRSRAAQLASVASTTTGPLPMHMRTFQLGLVESTALHGAAAYMTKATKTALETIDRAQRVGCRAVCGALTAVDKTSLHLESDTVPISHSAYRKSLNFWEKSRRVNTERFQGVARYEPCQSSTAGMSHRLQRTLPPRKVVPREAGKTAIDAIIPPNRRREHRLTSLSTKPWEATDALMKRIRIEAAPTLINPNKSEKVTYNINQDRRLRIILEPTHNTHLAPVLIPPTGALRMGLGQQA